MKGLTIILEIPIITVFLNQLKREYSHSMPTPLTSFARKRMENNARSSIDQKQIQERFQTNEISRRQ